MKAMGALDIEADVTRVIPPRSEDPEIVAYYEYCDFTKETGLYSILFSRPGSYQKLTSLPGINKVQISINGETDRVLRSVLRLDEIYSFNEEIIKSD